MSSYVRYRTDCKAERALALLSVHFHAYGARHAGQHAAERWLLRAGVSPLGRGIERVDDGRDAPWRLYEEDCCRRPQPVGRPGHQRDRRRRRGSRGGMECAGRKGRAGRLHLARRQPPHEARLYAMMHLAIHDALNAIDRRSRPYAFDGQARKRRFGRRRRGRGGPRRARPGPQPDTPLAGVPRRRGRQRRSRLHGRPRRDPGRTGQESGRGSRAGGRGRHTRPEGGRRFGHAAAGFQLSAGHGAGRVPLHAGLPLRIVARMGERHSVRAAAQRTVPSGPQTR